MSRRHHSPCTPLCNQRALDDAQARRPGQPLAAAPARPRLALLALPLAALLAACPSVAPTNPYDPDTPPDQQAHASLAGRIATPGVLDASGVVVRLLRGGASAYSTTSTALAESLGGFSFDSVVPGTYRLVVRPEDNPQLPGYDPPLFVTLGPGDAVSDLLLTLGADLANAGAVSGVVRLEGELGEAQPDHQGVMVQVQGLSYQTFTNEGGSFSLLVPPSPAGNPYTFHFSYRDHQPATRTASVPAGGAVQLSTASDPILLTLSARRPAPVLLRVEPPSLVALSATSYAITAVGQHFASDTRLRVGDFELAARCEGGSLGFPGCTDANATATACDGASEPCYNCCQALLDPSSPAWALMHNAGTYLVRAVTPAPVMGTGVSLESDFLSIVAPLPEIVDYTVLADAPVDCLLGEVAACLQPPQRQRYIMEGEGGATVHLLAWTRRLMDNCYAKLAGSFGQVHWVVPDDAASDDPLARVALISFSSISLPPREEPYTLVIANSPAGGGEDAIGFGVNWWARPLPVGDAPFPAFWRTTDLPTRAPGVFVDRFAAPLDQLGTADLEASASLALGLSAAGTLALHGPGPDGLAEGVAGQPFDDRLLYRSASAPWLAGPLGTALASVRASGRPGSYALRRGLGAALVPDGSFVEAGTLPTPTWPVDLALGDLDNDGLADLVTINLSDGTFSVALHAPGPGLSLLPARAYYACPHPRRVLLGEHDGDGAPDLVVACAQASGTLHSGELLVFGGLGDGQFVAPYREGTRLEGAAYVAQADFDGNGILDLVSTTGEWGIGLSRGNGDGSFAHREPWPYGGAGFQHPIALAATDLDGDGLMDVLVGHQNSALSIFWGRGDGGFTTPDSPLALGSASTYMHGFALGDFNGDGLPDVVPYYDGNSASLWLQAADGSFSRSAALPLAGNAGTALPADLDGDGRLDLAVTTRFAGSRLALVRGDGAGGLTPAGSHDLPYLGNERALPIGRADLDGDGSLDLAVALDSSSGVRVFSAQGAPPPATSDSRSDADILVSLAAGHFDADGRADLLGLSQVLGGQGQVKLLPGSASGTSLLGPLELTLVDDLSQWYDLAVADLDGDGLDDLVASGKDASYAGVVRVLLRAADGSSFDPPVTDLATHDDQPRHLLLARLDNDALLDLVVTDSAGTSLSWYRGLGNGAFDARAAIPLAGLQPLVVASGDFDADGAADLAVAGSASGNLELRVLRNTGGGSFSASTPFQSPGGAYCDWLAVVDLDADGRDDIVIGGSVSGASGGATLLGNTGAGFEPETLRIGYYAQSLLAADLDADGHADLVAAYGDWVSVVLANPWRDWTPVAYRLRQSIQNNYNTLAAGDLDGDGVRDLAIGNAYATGSPGTGLPLLVLRPHVYPRPVRQELSDLPLASVGIMAGANHYRVSQGAQYVHELAVRLQLRFAQQLAGAVYVSLMAPDGATVDLVDLAAGGLAPWPAAAPRAYRYLAHYPTTTPADPLAPLAGPQPIGDWVLTIDNQSGQVGELADFALLTRGAIARQ